MNPGKVDRKAVRALTDLPNVGPAMVRDFESLGIRQPSQLVCRDPAQLYRRLCAKHGRQDPCVMDVLISVTRFMDGGAARPWWKYTAERKKKFPDL